MDFSTLKNNRAIQVAILWFLFILFFPKNSDIASFSDPSERRNTGEGLYKAKTTKANFGLLGVEFFETSDNVRRWHIISEFAELHRKENYAFLQNVTANFYAEKTGNLVVTKSDYGRSWTDKNLIELEGNISILSKKGYLFTMEKLNYNSKTHEFETDDLVHMKGPNVQSPTMLLKGVGLLADIDREHFILQKDVEGKKKMKKNEWLKIRSRSGEFFTDESRAVFISNVNAELPKAQIQSNLFEISGEAEKESLEARGSVILKSRDRVGKADSALIEVGSDKIILEGRAKIESKENVIMGRRIIMYTDDDRVEVVDAEGKARQ